jgi:UDP-glucuronate decarboxylase
MQNLVTGAAGFLGFHLCKKLLNAGEGVIGVDNLFTGQKKNIDALSSFNKFEFQNLDVTDVYHFDVDRIFNLACPASPIHYQSDPIKTSRTSFLGALNGLELAHSLKVPILQASTSEVYGDPHVHPQVEEYWGNVNPIGIRSCYDEGKRSAETLFFDFHRERGTKIKVMRIFNTYGPNMHPNDGRVVSNFINQALSNSPITIYGDGCQTRSFCYVDDLIEGMQLLMNSNDLVTGPINFGNPNEIAVLDLAKLIIELTGSKSEIILKDLPKDDPTRRNPDISKAKSILGWEPSTDLQTGIEATINYFRQRS